MDIDYDKLLAVLDDIADDKYEGRAGPALCGGAARAIRALRAEPDRDAVIEECARACEKVTSGMMASDYANVVRALKRQSPTAKDDSK